MNVVDITILLATYNRNGDRDFLKLSADTFCGPGAW